MENTYPFAALDELLEVKLDPHHPGYTPLRETELACLVPDFTQQLESIFRSLKTQTFFLFTGKQIAPIAGTYLWALKELQAQARANLHSYGDDEVLCTAGEKIAISLDTLERRILKRYGRYLGKATQVARNLEEEAAEMEHKIKVKLSVDQIAVILKAADDAKLLIARSLSAVFRSIMPHLSTDKVKDISWKSARSSTYKFESNDKETAISTLEELIRRIRLL